MAVVVCVQQSQWLEVISRQQHGSYDVEMTQEEQEVLDYSYSELVISITTRYYSGVESF